MKTINIIFFAIFIMLAVINCIIAKKDKNQFAFNGWLCSIFMAINSILNEL